MSGPDVRPDDEARCVCQVDPDNGMWESENTSNPNLARCLLCGRPRSLQQAGGSDDA